MLTNDAVYIAITLKMLSALVVIKVVAIYQVELVIIIPFRNYIHLMSTFVQQRD
jgi:hypothetical protein